MSAPFSHAVALCLISLTGCNLIFPKVANSDLREDERVVLRLEPNNDQDLKLNYKHRGVQANVVPLAGLAAAAIPVVAGYAIDAAKKALDNEAQLHTASYASRESDEFFKTKPTFTNKEIAAVVSLSGFRVIRYADDGPQAVVSFALESSTEGDGFRLKLTKMAIRGCKAKVFYPRWWTKVLIYGFFQEGHESVDVQVTVDLQAIWTGNAQTLHDQSLAHVVLDPKRMSLTGKDSLNLADIEPVFTLDKANPEIQVLTLVDFLIGSKKVTSVGKDDYAAVTHTSVPNDVKEGTKIRDYLRILFLNGDYNDTATKKRVARVLDMEETDVKSTFVANVRASKVCTFDGWTVLEPSNSTGWLHAPPVSLWGGNEFYVWGKGLYDLSVTVVESDDFGKYVTSGADLLGKEKATILQRLEAIK